SPGFLAFRTAAERSGPAFSREKNRHTGPFSPVAGTWKKEPARSSGFTPLPCRSGALRQFGSCRDDQSGLLNPAAGIGGPVPALKGNAADVVSFLVVQYFKIGLRETGPDLGTRTAQVDQPIVPVVKNRHRPPSLGLGFGVIKHGLTLLGL